MSAAIFVVTAPPWPVRSGVQTKLASLLEAAEVEVHVISPAPFRPPSHHIVCHVVGTPGSVPQVMRAMIGKLKGLLPSQSRVDAASILSEIDDVLAHSMGTVHVHLDTIALAHLAAPVRGLLRSRDRTGRVLCSLNDSYSFLKSEAGVDHGWSGLARRFIEFNERRFLPDSDLVDVVSATDVGWLAKVAPRANTRIVPLGIRPEWVAGGFTESSELYDLLLFSGGPGVNTFVDVGLPRLRQCRPGIKVAMIGPEPPVRSLASYRALGVEYLGFVDDVAAAVRQSKVVLAPSQQRCGLSNRAMLAFSNARCVVGGRCLMNFQGARAGRDFLMSNSTNGMVDLVLVALADDRLRAGIGRSAQIYAGSLPSSEEVAKWYWDDIKVGCYDE
ncbi:MAG TPA: glycosyltransferase [Marmoricola sp.]|nr:glycosyltransferase [Marmoricola sp.]